MNKYLLKAAFLVVPISTCSAVDLALDYSIIQVDAAFGPLISSNSTPLTYPGNQSSAGQQLYDGSIARAQIDYKAIDSESTATFDFEVDLQGTHTGPLHNSTAQTFVSLSLQLNQPMAYTIGGTLKCATDVPGVEFYGNWVFFDSYSANYYYQKEKWAFDSAVLDADDLPDPWMPTWPPETTGILPASTYFFYFIAELDTTNAPGATANVTGFTNLTLSRLVPEPGSVALVTGLLGIALFSRQILPPSL